MTQNRRKIISIETSTYSDETQEILDFLYHKSPETMVMPSGEEVEIPASGNLGLLSLGYIGLLAMRKKRERLQGDKIQFPLLRYLAQTKDNL